MKSYAFSMFLTEKFLNIDLFYFSFWKKINEKKPNKVQVNYITSTETWNWV